VNRLAGSARERSLGREPSLGFAGAAKNANLGEVSAGEYREHSHHAEEGVAGGYHGTSAEADFSSDTIYFLRYGGDFSCKWKGSGLAQVEENVEVIGTLGVPLQGAEVIDDLAHHDIPDAAGADELFPLVDCVRDRHRE